MILFSAFLWTASLGVLIYISSFHPILKQDSTKLVKYRSKKERKFPESPFQFRSGVAKDLWISSKEGRIYCHIESPSSSLCLKKSVIETLSQLKIWIQEPNQEIRYLRAASGDFNYAMHTLSSHEAFLSSYKVNDPKSTIFSCVAKDLFISFDDAPFGFSASGFSAHLQSQGGL